MHFTIKKLIFVVILIVVSLLIVLNICIDDNKFIKNKLKTLLNNNDTLTISTLNKDEKGNIVTFSPDNKTEKIIIQDRNVAVSGSMNDNGTEVAYVDALGDSDPWQVYLYNIKTKQNKQITNNELGKANAKLSQDNSIYFMTSTEDNGIKIGKVDIDTQEFDIIDGNNLDRKVDAFDLKNNKLIISTDSYDEEMKKQKENKGIKTSVCHTIFKTNLDGENLEEIAHIDAALIDSVSISYNENKIIVAGRNINGDSGYGIYELDVKSGNINTILTDNIVANTENSIIKQISHPALATFSKDENIIYFTASLKDSEMENIAGLFCYPSTIFSYNKNSGEIQEVFTPSTASVIFDLNIT